MKYLVIFLLFGLSIPVIAQTEKDSARINVKYEYLTIIVEEAGSSRNVFISNDSLKYEKKTSKDAETFNLVEVVGLLSRFNKDGWLVQSSNMALAGDSYPYRSYLYYLLYRKKR